MNRDYTWRVMVVARDGIEPPTPAFSGPRSTTELSGLGNPRAPFGATLKVCLKPRSWNHPAGHISRKWPRRMAALPLKQP
jgi:hypothetical protein